MTSTEQQQPKAGFNRHQQGRVSDFYSGQCVLVTGATGFVGKALIEKLLRTCLDVDTVFLLIRPKHGVEVEARLKELLKNPIFERVRNDCPGQLAKVRAVAGDVSRPGLGLGVTDRVHLCERVNVVLHIAATVRFNEALKLAVLINTLGTKRVVELAKQMKNLQAFVHVSTAYSNADRREIEERVYPPPADPEGIIKFVQAVPSNLLDSIENKIIGNHPNTYTYTKALAESIVAQEGASLPVAIVRPSIVTAAWQEPFPGWVDNMSGITGLSMEIGRGTARTAICDSSLTVDIVPVDMVVNSILLAAAQLYWRRPSQIAVYNVTSGSINPIKWGELLRLILLSARKFPSKHVQWYPGCTFRLNRFLNRTMQMILHFFPAIIIDILLRFKGIKPIMLRIYERTRRSALTGEFFATNEFDFKIDSMRALSASLDARDKPGFTMDVGELQWERYITTFMLGIRQFILKDDSSSLANARSKLRKLYWCQRILQGVALFVFLRCAVAIR